MINTKFNGYTLEMSKYKVTKLKLLSNTYKTQYVSTVSSNNEYLVVIDKYKVRKSINRANSS